MQREPKKSDTLEVRLAHETKQALMAKAANEGQSASEVVRSLVAHYLAVSSSSAVRSSRVGLGTVAQLTLSLVGYGLAACFLALAASKPLVPSEVGVWKIPDPFDPLTFSVGRVSAPGAQELVGWWIIPISLILTLLTGYVSWRVGSAGIRTIQQYRARQTSQ
jgi:hypothetical protein